MESFFYCIGNYGERNARNLCGNCDYYVCSDADEKAVLQKVVKPRKKHSMYLECFCLSPAFTGLSKRALEDSNPRPFGP